MSGDVGYLTYLSVIAGFFFLIAVNAVFGAWGIGVAGLIFSIALLVWYLKDRPRRSAEKALKQGRVHDGLLYFWQCGNHARIKKHLETEEELPLPKRRFIVGWLNSDPQFRPLILHNFALLNQLLCGAFDPANIFISDEIKLETFHRTTCAAKYLFITAQQLSVLARNGERKIKANSMHTTFAELERRLITLRDKLGHAHIELKKYTGSPYEYEAQFRWALEGLDMLAEDVSNRREAKREAVQQLLDAPTDDFRRTSTFVADRHRQVVSIRQHRS